MKHSMRKIFTNLSLTLVFIMLSTLIVLLFTLEQNISFAKVNNLKHQKEIVNTLKNLKKDDIELALIQFNGKSAQLHQEIEKLKDMNKYDYLGQYMLFNKDEFLNDLKKLSQLTDNFNKAAKNYYTKDKKDEKLHLEELKNSFKTINSYLDSMILKNIAYEEKKFNIFEKVVIFTFVLTFFAMFWYRKRLDLIYADIVHLYAIDKHKQDHQIFSLEADAIRLRMHRKPANSDDPAMLDPVTQINNYKGMFYSYSNKKGIKESNFTSVTILEIDNFSKQKRAYSQEFTQAILKKIAFSISLHEQATDVIARTDYNQFTIILSRTSKEQSFRDIDIIRQSISEIKFKEPGGESVTITVSGGFVIKPNNQTLDEALKRAREILQYAKKTGKNAILQTKDIADRNI